MCKQIPLLVLVLSAMLYSRVPGMWSWAAGVAKNGVGAVRAQYDQFQLEQQQNLEGLLQHQA